MITFMLQIETQWPNNNLIPLKKIQELHSIMGRSHHRHSIWKRLSWGQLCWKKMQSYLDKEEEFNCNDYKARILNDLGINKARPKLGKAVSVRYKITGIAACADVDWPGQGNPPTVYFKRLCIELTLENKKIRKQQLRNNLKSAERAKVNARKKLESYP